MTNPYESPITDLKETENVPVDRSAFGLVCSIFACIVSGIALAAPIPSLLEMSSHPPGTAMRPMVATAMAVLGSLGGLVFAVPLALVGLFAARRSAGRNWLGYVALLIAILAAFGPLTVLELIIRFRRYVMQE
jgi:hypothetical protein